MSSKEKIIRHFIPKEFIVLGLELMAENNELQLIPFGGIKCRLKKKSLQVETIEVKDTLNLQLEFIKRTPVLLQIEGEQIIHRLNIEKEQEEKNNVYEEIDDHSPYSTIMSLSLRQQLEEELLKIKKDWIGIALGCHGFHPFLTEYQGGVGKFVYEEIPYFDPQPVIPLNFKGEETNTLILSLYVRALEWLSQAQRNASFISWLWGVLKERIMKVGIPFMFLLLIVNFLLYQPLYNEMSTLESTMMSAEFKNWQEKRELIQQRQVFIQSYANGRPGQLTWYADQLIQSMPKGLVLNQLEVDAIQGNLRPRKAPQHKRQSIIIKGIANQGEQVEKWMGEINQNKWVNSCTLTRYGVKDSNIEFEFTIKTIPL